MHSLPLPTAGRQSRPGIWIILIAVGVFVLGGAGIIFAIVFPALRVVHTATRKEEDQAVLRKVVQAALVWSSVHEGRLPLVHLFRDGVPSDTEPATVHAVAAALARGAGLNDMSIWAERSRGAPGEMIVERIDRGVNPAFLQLDVVAWDFATGLDVSLPAATPVAWTRGLQSEGTWSEDSAYGTDGGFVGFLGGGVQFFRNLQSTPLTAPDGSVTSNILEALPASVRVVGSGPGTLHGAWGLAETN